MTLTGSATKADWQTALRSVTYTNTSDTPDTGNRTLNFVVNDGALGSNTAAKTVSVTAVNDAPVLAASGGTTAHTENVPVVVDSGITVTDADSANLASGTVTIGAGYTAGQDVLGFTTQNGITGSWNAPTMTLTGSATKADWQTALRSVTYTNTSDTPDTGDRTLNFVVNDGTLDSNTAAKTVTVTAVNDAPVAGGEWWHDRPHRERAGGGRLGHHRHRRRQREPGVRHRDRRCRVHRRPGRARLHHPERHHRFLERTDDDADRQRHQGGLADRAAVGHLHQHQRQPGHRQPHHQLRGQRRHPGQQHRREDGLGRRRQRRPGPGGEWWHDRPHRERAGGGRLGHHRDRRRQREPGVRHRRPSVPGTPPARTCSASPTRTASPVPGVRRR